MEIQPKQGVLHCIALAFAVVLVSGCAAKYTAPSAPVNDPFEPVNRVIFNFNDKLDRVALQPLARGYKKVAPSVVRKGVSNFFGNLGDVTVVANDFLQGKFEQGIFDTARVAVNTTLGLGGIMDIASKMDLARHEEDFGQTLGYWGLPEGPYLILPFFGSRTLRGTAGILLDNRIEPLNTLNVNRGVRDKLIVLNVVNARSNYLAASSILDTAAIDPYSFVRDAYVRRRRNLVSDGVRPVRRQQQTSEVPTSAARRGVAKGSQPEDSIDKIDQLDEIDELDELDEIDKLDELDEIDKLDQLDEPALSTSEQPDEIDRLDELDSAEPLDEIDRLDLTD